LGIGAVGGLVPSIRFVGDPADLERPYAAIDKVLAVRPSSVTRNLAPLTAQLFEPNRKLKFVTIAGGVNRMKLPNAPLATPPKPLTELEPDTEAHPRRRNSRLRGGADNESASALLVKMAASADGQP